MNFNLSAIRLNLFLPEADSSDCINGSGSVWSSKKRMRILLRFQKADPDPPKIYYRPKIKLLQIEWNSLISASQPNLKLGFSRILSSINLFII